MGIFTEADHHPFHEQAGFVSGEEAHGSSSVERWGDEQRPPDYVPRTESARVLYIRDESLTRV